MAAAATMPEVATFEVTATEVVVITARKRVMTVAAEVEVGNRDVTVQRQEGVATVRGYVSSNV